MIGKLESYVNSGNSLRGNAKHVPEKINPCPCPSSPQLLNTSKEVQSPPRRRDAVLLSGSLPGTKHAKKCLKVLIQDF